VFTVNGAEVRAAPAGPGLWRARVARPGAGDLRIGFRDAHLLLAAGSGELEGLFPRPDVAASIARRTGGRLVAGEESEAPPHREGAPHVTLLAAAGLVLVGALVRRRG
jgi:hypothetical protein